MTSRIDIVGQNGNTGEHYEAVHSPKHYTFDEPCSEVIDVIRNVLGPSGFISYCHGNVIKYVLRAYKKNGQEDFKKALKYLEYLLDETNKTGKFDRSSTKCT